ncbi:MAG: 50S ribosomal protein L15e [Candidatus Diapherotrites archaeon]
MSLTAQVTETIHKEFKGKKDENYDYRKLYREKLVDLRKKFRSEKKSTVRIDKPTNLARAKKLGYAAKEGILLVLVKVRKGSGLHRKPVKGRRPKRMGVKKLTRRIPIQGIGEQRVAKKYPNCEVINSYFIAEDGTHKFYEVILYDTSHPAIQNDRKRNWVCDKQHKGRVFRGLTSAQKKSRGLRSNKGKGHGLEKARPSLRAHDRKLK